MARRPNYGAEKRQKEIQRQKKKEEKAEKKRLKKEAVATGDQDEEVVDGAGLDTAPDRDERERNASN